MMKTIVPRALLPALVLAALAGCAAAPRPAAGPARPGGTAIQLWLGENPRAGYPELRLDAALRTAEGVRGFRSADFPHRAGGARRSGIVPLDAAGAAEMEVVLRAPSGDTLAAGRLPVRLAAGCLTAVSVDVRTAEQAAGLPGPRADLRVPLRGAGDGGAAMYVRVALAALGTPGEPCRA